ncbi:MAG: hypothetical protein V4449_02045 [Patescibacteria group bacterium]
MSKSYEAEEIDTPTSLNREEQQWQELHDEAMVEAQRRGLTGDLLRAWIDETTSAYVNAMRSIAERRKRVNKKRH